MQIVQLVLIFTKISIVVRIGDLLCSYILKLSVLIHIVIIILLLESDTLLHV